MELKILIVDDDPDVGHYIKLRVQKEAPDFTIDAVIGGRECLEYIKEKHVDCILSDYQMPEMNGMELLQTLRCQGSDIPFIFITGQGNEQIAKDAFIKGANDYFTKDVGFAHFAKIINSVEVSVKHRDAERAKLCAEAALMDEKKKLESILESMADAVSIQDTEFKVLYQNQPHKTMIGEHVGQYCYKAYERRKQVCDGCPVAAAFRDGMTHTAERAAATDKGKVVVEISASPLRDSSGKIIAGIEAVRDVTERKRAEETLTETNLMLNALVESSPVPIVTLDPEGNVRIWNKAAERAFGWDRKEVFGRYVPFVPEEKREEFLTIKRRILGGEAFTDLELTRQRKDGSLADVRVSTAPLSDAKGRINGLVAIILDITEQRRAEETLKERERFLENVFTSIQDGISVLDSELNIVRVNPSMERWYSHAMPLVGKKCYSAYHNHTQPCDICPSGRALRTGYPAYDIVPKRGAEGQCVGWLDLYSFPMVDSKTGLVTGVIEYVRDITGRRQVEKERERLFKGISASNEGIAFTDKDDRFVYVNSAHARIYGYASAELVGKTWRDITLPELEEQCERYVTDNLHNKEIGEFTRELPALRKDGTTIPVEVNATALWGEEGDYQGHVCIARDITERKDIERQRADFYAMLTHDIKSPLMVMLVYAELLAEETVDINEETNAIITLICNNGKKLCSLVEDFLSLSRIESGKLSLNLFPSDITMTLKEVCADSERAYQKKGLTLNVEMAAGLPAKAMIDEKLVQRAVSNLLQNAVNYTPSGGEITLRVGKTVEKDKGFIVILVKDTGRGIPAEEQEKVFEKYYRSPKTAGIKGTGLGLAIVKEIAEAHGGRVEVESEIGKGSTFRLFLPLNS